MPDISVVLCAYTEERWDDLVRAVSALQGQSVRPREIITVIDHNDGLLKGVDENLGGVVAIENKQQRGLSGARNSGIMKAQGDVVAFIDEDAVPAPDWLEQLSRAYADPLVMGAGGAIEPAWQTSRPGWFPQEFDWVVGCSYRGMPLSSGPVRNLIGCNMSFRREIFEAIGGFRHGIGRIGTHPTGCEETEFCIRAKQHWPERILYYEPRARVYHRVRVNRTRWRYFGSRCYFEGRSKALVASLAGSRDGLATEWTYTFQTLPRGVIRGVQDSIRQGDSGGLARATAIIGGLAITTAGYLTGRLGAFVARQQWSDRPAMDDPETL